MSFWSSQKLLYFRQIWNMTQIAWIIKNGLLQTNTITYYNSQHFPSVNLLLFYLVFFKHFYHSGEDLFCRDLHYNSDAAKGATVTFRRVLCGLGFALRSVHSEQYCACARRLVRCALKRVNCWARCEEQRCFQTLNWKILSWKRLSSYHPAHLLMWAMM